MPVVHTPESNYAKEMRRHEAYHTQFGPPGRPYAYRDYPTRMYKAERLPSGDRTFEAQTAEDEHQRRNLESRGFVVGGQQAALDALTAVELEHAKLAAEINYDVRHGMGDRARAEVDQAQESAGAKHLPMIPEVPIKKRGRPAKAVDASS